VIVVLNNIALVIHKRDDDKCVWHRICVTVRVITVAHYWLYHQTRCTLHFSRR